MTEANLHLFRETHQILHDIRSPLTTLNFVISSLENISDEKRGLLQRALDRMNAIANQNLKKNICSAKKLTQVLLSLMEEKRFEYKNLSQLDLRLRSRGSDPRHIPLDMSALERALSNLINNAIEATYEKTRVSQRIQISVINRKSETVILVHDNGVGIPPYILSHIGEWGFSLKNQEGHGAGRGLGLYQVKKAIESVGGFVCFRSRPGRGTRVSLHIPKQ